VLELDGTTPEIVSSFQDSSDDTSFTTLLECAAASSASQVFTGSVASASRYRRIRYDLEGTSPSTKIQFSTGSYMKP